MTPNSLEHISRIGATVLELAVVVLGFLYGSARRFPALHVYFTLCVPASVLRWFVLKQFGVASTEYVYVYYYSDALLSIALFFVIVELYSHVLPFPKAGKLLILFGVVAFLAALEFSYAVVSQTSTRLLTHLVVEMNQNLYFCGIFFSFVLWAITLYRKMKASAAVNLVWVVLVYFVIVASAYASGNFNNSEHVRALNLLAVIWLPAGAALAAAGGPGPVA